NTALYLLKDCNDAEDIAQIVCLKFLQNQKQIENPISWCNTVARHEVFALLKKQKLQITGLDAKLEFLEAERSETCKEIIPEFETITYKEAKTLLSKEEYKFYNLMLKYKQDPKKIAKHLKRSISYVYGLSYRVKRNLVSAKLLKEGYRGTKEIVGYKLHQNILNFIKTLKKKMEKDDLQAMHNYFRDIDITKIPKLDITETLDYHIHLLGERYYDVYIPYKNSHGHVQFCITDFKIDPKNNIIITRFYPKPALVIEIDDPEDKLMNEFKPRKKGLLTETKKEAKEIIKNFIRK
ncbi:MAG: sigma-70 family RNA polymerase sigma factor, partial [Candidatus Cloacimonetes bacterium]|nr:sigma-70 family RNA polymerase sigma factor [Candidatus Cloacimonadota bacterium]